jgi:hypothetical protein
MISTKKALTPEETAQLEQIRDHNMREFDESIARYRHDLECILDEFRHEMDKRIDAARADSEEKVE